jgi:hypothetical protein
MSEPSIGTPPPPKGGGAKLFGMNRNTVIIIGVATLAGVGYYIWKSRKAATTTAANPNQQTGTTGECTDANGNPTPCEDMAGVDYSGQLSVLQTEIESLLAQQGTGTTTGTTTTTTTPPPAATQVNQYPSISFTAKKLNSTAIAVQFKALTSPTPVPTSYTIEAWTVAGAKASVQTVTAPDSTGGSGQYTITGLKAGTCYNVRVWANGGKVAPTGTTEKVCL